VVGKATGTLAIETDPAGLDVIVETVTDDGRPNRIRLDYDPEHVRFMSWNPARRTFEHVTLPEVGMQISL